MDGGGYFRGTSAEQDNRFSDKEKKLLKVMKFPAHFNQKVDKTKVNLPSFRKWITKELEEVLSYDDDVLVDYIIELLEGASPDPKTIQIKITGFLAEHTDGFMDKLWRLLLEAQSTVSGIPDEFLKDVELMSASVAAEENRIQEGISRAQQKMGNMSRVDTRFDQQQSQATAATAPLLPAPAPEAAPVPTTVVVQKGFSDMPPPVPVTANTNVVYGLNVKPRGGGGEEGDNDIDNKERKYRRFDVVERPHANDVPSTSTAAVAPASDEGSQRLSSEHQHEEHPRDERYRSERDRERYRDDYERRDRDRDRERDRERLYHGGERDRRDRYRDEYDRRDRYHDDYDRDRRDRYHEEYDRDRRDRDRGGYERERYHSSSSSRDERYRAEEYDRRESRHHRDDDRHRERDDYDRRDRRK
ncbi:hypothetical protein SAMD00019534_027020 [Acytostelium subglobosum LB1]|uniref:hypothetical protein n=1 Tax=Acytostelium subglobosum LB1 TaxID=1410327 RepID=UPI0006448792|nr:hypothetical protein SAMD00019534_027020 [Acytostelium subglobosum LB1]GAM19527.1 hypothetical protein SAMD00019534_027020 [Acytostelium subglobosum LB1]|eukprot:XP_012757454.1 hypothetical protein SAMD00019534_027020 [Acytostelium subglobosum LB1]